MATDRKQLACAIYTRKSSDEGLEQEFNSLDAQREACEAFVTSQRHEGWKLVTNRYDDGGFSGGNMDRPGLKSLLEDVSTGKVNVIVVYKVDRLTRSLSDFAKIVEVLDDQAASFVSVTQQFNTTTSMGRLTLNVLLSFAQFEREVTGERIRDKIAASKRKGMWMGGVVPIGYDIKDRRLVVNEAEAEIVRGIFRTYLQFGNVRLLQRDLAQRGILTKQYKCANGKIMGGRAFTRGHLYELLNNRLYLGEVVHKGQIYPGQHEGIINLDLWERVQSQLAQNAAERSEAKGVKHPSLLAGLIYDDRGNRLTPTHTIDGSIRRRYYVCQALLQNQPDKVGVMRRIPAMEVEPLVEGQVFGLLERPAELIQKLLGAEVNPEARHALVTAAKALKDSVSTEAEKRRLIRSVLRKVVVGPDSVELVFNGQAMTGELSYADGIEKLGDFVIEVAAHLKRCGRQRRLIISDSVASGPSVNGSLVRLLEQGFQWNEQVRAGKTIQDIANRETLHRSYVGRVVRLAFLAPDIVEAIIDGRHKPDLKVKKFFTNLPMDWAEQRRFLGFPVH